MDYRLVYKTSDCLVHSTYCVKPSEARKLIAALRQVGITNVWIEMGNFAGVVLKNVA